MFDHDAQVLYDGYSRFPYKGGCFRAYDAELHPEQFGKRRQGKRFTGMIGTILGSPEDIDDVDGAGDFGERGIRLQSPDVLSGGVDRDNLIPGLNEIATYAIPACLLHR